MKPNNGVLSLLLLLCFFISLDCAFKPQLYSSGGSACQYFQETRNPFLDIIAYIFAELASLLTPTWAYFIMYERDVHHGIKCVSLYCWVRYGISMLKILYSEPRPFWIYSWVSAVDCSEGFGNPSGHALLTGILWPYYYSYTFISDPYFIKRSVMILGLVSIGADRIYSGVHFYSQVVLGWIYAGSILLFLFAHNLKIDKLTFKVKSSYRNMIICLGVSILGVSLGLLLPTVRFPYWDDDWTDRYEDACGRELDEKDALIKDRLGTTVLGFFYGSILGYYLLEKVQLRNWSGGESRLKRVIRFGILILITLGWYSLELFILRRIHDDNLMYLVILCERFVVGVLISFVIPYISEILKLNNTHSEDIENDSLLNQQKFE